MKDFSGYHSEWNLGSPGGWDYQRLTQIIGKAVWGKLNQIKTVGVDLDFDNSVLYPVDHFVKMLVNSHRKREGNNPGLIAVVAEEETLKDVTENINLARHLDTIDGLSGALMAPHELELVKERVCWKGQTVSTIFVDFNTDVLLKLHRKLNLKPLLQAVKEHRVINPRGTEPINVKSMFEVVTGNQRYKFHKETVQRTPWTRQFYPRSTEDSKGEKIQDLIEWTRFNWQNLVLKPERGYSGQGVRVGKINPDPDEAIQRALRDEPYIVQEKIPLFLWSEEIPTLINQQIVLAKRQTDFRCLFGPEGLFGFLGRYGGVPTNVGSGGGVQAIAVLKSEISVREAVKRINEAFMSIPAAELEEIIEMQKKMAVDLKFTYLLGPIKNALRPRIITLDQIDSLRSYCGKLWTDCLLLEKMWISGELDNIIKIEAEELEIAKMQPWGGSDAILASDGLFSFGAEPENI